MNELLEQIVATARGMWRHRWAAVMVAWLVAVIATVVVFRIPNQYEATARVHVDTQSILKPLMSGLAVQPNVEQQVGMLSRTLISRPNVEKLVRMADLDLGSASKAQQDLLVDSLIKELKISAAGRDNLFSLSYRHPEQEKAKRVIQSLVSIFVESSLGASRKDADSAKVFLNEQIKTFEAKLEESEARLKAFRLRNIDMQVGDGKDAASRIGELSRQYEDARLLLREAENARDSARRQLDSARTSDLPDLLASVGSGIEVSTPEIDGRIDVQKRALDTLLQRFTERHPDVANARRLIKDLEAQREREVARKRKAAAAQQAAEPVLQATSLAVQELHRMVAASEVQVASLKARVSEFGSRLASARQSLKLAPQLEAEAAQLNRDYEITKKNYEDLVARRQAAAMSSDLESASGIADFRLIDPPRVSPKPVFPNRLLLLPLALAAALAAGLFTAFAASQIRPVFTSAADLRAKTGLPMLGVVTAVLDPAQVRRSRMDKLRFAAASTSLFLVFGLGLAAMALLSARGG